MGVLIRTQKWQNRRMAQWVAVGCGAVDISGLPQTVAPPMQYAVLPQHPNEPIAFGGDAADLWGKLLAGPVDDGQLGDKDRALAREFEAVGIASSDPHSPKALSHVGAPRLSSYPHELVNSLVYGLARDLGIRAVIIKGPALHAQGLRSRQHSGDVDIWVEPGGAPVLAAAMAPWGWEIAHDPFREFPQLIHSYTVRPEGWGCEVDIHVRYPGVAREPAAAFEALWAMSENRVYAGVEVRVPKVPAHAVIQALTLARPDRIVRKNASDRTDAVDEVLRAGGPGTAEFAHQVGAIGALGENLARVYPDAGVGPAEPPPDWKWRGNSSKLGYMLSLLDAVPWHRRPLLAWRIGGMRIASMRARSRGDQGAE